MANNPPFCKDCKWLGTILHKLESLCHHPEAIIDPAPDLVTGEPRRRAHAYEMRQVFGKCGLDGKLFETEF